MSGAVLVDTGPIVAILSASDQHHDACLEELGKIKGRLLTCWPVITEAAWLLRAHPTAIALLLKSFKGSPFELVFLGDADLPLIGAIMGKYSDLGIQLADACLVHLASRESVQTIFTLDRRDFGVIRLAGGKKLRVVPGTLKR